MAPTARTNPANAPRVVSSSPPTRSTVIVPGGVRSTPKTNVSHRPAAIEAVPAPTAAELRREARHRDALRRARVREAQVRAAMATVPAPRTAYHLPRRTPLPD